MRRDEIEASFERYGPMVYRRARAILGTDAEARDVVQEVFIKLLSGKLKNEDGPLAGWLATVTTRACYNLRRDRRRRGELLAERPFASSEDAVAEQQVLVRHLLDRLEPRVAEAAVCVHVDGMTYDETAAQLGVSRRTVGNLLSRFQTAAKALLEPAAIGESG